MHWLYRGTASFVLFATAGCAGANFTRKDFNGIDSITWESSTSGLTFQIIDKPQENRLLIARDSQEMSPRANSASPLPIITDTSPASYESAAIEWLKSNGRTCTTKSTFIIAESLHEIRYSCEGPFPSAPSKPAPW